MSNVTKAIDGLAPGVQATTGSGQPGSSSSIYIRGMGSINASKTPLYVVMVYRMTVLLRLLVLMISKILLF